MITQEMRDKWTRHIAFCKKHTNKLDEWSLGFIDSIDKLISEKKDLTIKQSFKLGEIYHKIEEAI
jgi:hypothetical protein